MRTCGAFSKLLFASLATGSFSLLAIAEDWSQFRGGASGVVRQAKLPTDWGPDENIRWKIEVPGIGWSQPVVWGDKVFVTTAEADDQAKPDPKNSGPGVSGFAVFLSGTGLADPQPPTNTHRWKILCLDAATGKVIWEEVVREGRPTQHIHANNTFASETPVTDGTRLIAYFGMMGVYCYDMSGELLWSKDLDAYPTQFGWGTGSSPMLFDDHVYIQCDNEKASFLMALDKKTGEEVWRVKRDERSNWSTPFIWANKLRTELVTAGGNRMRSYDPSTGELLWELTGSGRTSITPVGDEELLYVDSYDRLTGGAGDLVAIRAGALGDISPTVDGNGDSHVAWSVRVSGYRLASPLLYQGCLYVTEQNRGIVRCFDAKTGEEHYRKRLPGATGITASAFANDGRVYFLDQNCQTTVIEVGPELRVVAENELDEMCWASPAIVGDCLLIRTLDHLYCIGK